MVSKNCSLKMHFPPKFHNSGSTQVPVLKQRDGVPTPPLSLLPYEVAFSIIILNKQNKFDKCLFHFFLDVVNIINTHISTTKWTSTTSLSIPFHKFIDNNKLKEPGFNYHLNTKWALSLLMCP